jgi:hypothetical protein
MKEVSVTFSTPTSRDSLIATSLRASADGPWRCDGRDGVTATQSGRPASHVSHSPALGSSEEWTTSDTYGPKSNDSLTSESLQLSLENKLRAQLEKDGSTWCSMTWRIKATPAGRRYCDHVVSAGRRSGKGSIGLLPALSAREGRDWSRGRILASLDNGTGVAKRICALLQSDLLSEEICGLNPSFGGWMQGYPTEWADCMGLETPSTHE